MANPVVHFEVNRQRRKETQDFHAAAFGWRIDAGNPMNYGIVDPGGRVSAAA